MNGKFTFRERMGILGVLPQQGTVVALKTIRVLREELAIDQAEKIIVGMVEDPARGTSVWETEKEGGVAAKTIDITEAMNGVIVENLNRMNNSGQLTELQIGVYDRFVVNQEFSPKPEDKLKERPTDFTPKG